MKILVLGSHGMLGNEFMDILQHQSYEIHGVDKEDLDVRRAEKVRNYIQNQAPDVVINTTGYTDVDGAEQNTEEAYALNAYAPKYIAEASRDVDATLIHFSTDFVFNGQDASGYTEEQEPQQSVNTYGASKRRGEEYVMETDPFYYLIRTSWLFGKHGRNFV
ncbi:MAG: NAD(P)-dependent oxidoreductase, partial [Candidatus Paceibacteria bacterium]